ncbi:MAG: hypothetical protein RLZZ46_824 [Bacteroidota bacterium]
MEKEERSQSQGLTYFAPEPGYFLPLDLTEHIRQSREIFYEGYHFRKQTYRNRLIILTAAGIQRLSIPLLHPIAGMRYKAIRISYREPWQRQHFRAIATAYGKSPYYFYWHTELEILFSEQPEFLYEWNRRCLQLQAKMCKHPEPKFTDAAPEAMRYEEFHERLPSVTAYLQTFHDRFPFVSAVSGLDQGLNGS